MVASSRETTNARAIESTVSFSVLAIPSSTEGGEEIFRGDVELKGRSLNEVDEGEHENAENDHGHDYARRNTASCVRGGAQSQRPLPPGGHRGIGSRLAGSDCRRF